VDQAMRNPVYRARLAAVGITSGADIASLDDVRRLPFTDVTDLRDGYPLPLLCVPERDVVRVHASSGTTGKRKILAYTRKDVETFALQMARCYELAGLTPEDRVQVAVGYGLWTAGAGFQLGSELFGALTVPVGPGNLDMQLQLLMDLKVTCLGATASMALLLAEEVERHGLRDRLALRKVIFGAEPHSLKMRRAFTEKLGARASTTGPIFSLWKSSTPPPCSLSPPERWEKWSSPVCARRLCPLSATARTISPALSPNRAPAGAPSPGTATSAAVRTTWSSSAGSTSTPDRSRTSCTPSPKPAANTTLN